MDKKHLLANIVLFQCTWFSLVTGPLWLGGLFLACLALHGFMTSHDRKAQALLCLAVVLIGVVSDSLLMQFAVYQFDVATGFYHHIVPLWLILLWCAFALTLKHSLNWLQDIPWLMVVMLAIFGPLSYYAGAQLSPERITLTVELMVFSLVQWGTIGGLIILINRRVFKKNSHA